MSSRSFTRTEKVQRVALAVKYLRRDDDRVLDRIDRINDRAEDRALRERAAWQVEFDAAKNELAVARVAERSASRPERSAARRARQDAEKHLKRVERSEPRG